jgi:hypothetical protein
MDARSATNSAELRRPVARKRARVYAAAMSPRLRKLIGLVAILAFLVLYMGAVAQIAGHLPDHGPWQLIFFVLAGVLWGVPILPLISWMNRER